jgi:hypothetical protein
MPGLAGARSYPTAAVARVRARGVAGSTRPRTNVAIAELVMGKPLNLEICVIPEISW